MGLPRAEPKSPTPVSAWFQPITDLPESPTLLDNPRAPMTRAEEKQYISDRLDQFKVQFGDFKETKEGHIILGNARHLRYNCTWEEYMQMH